MKAENTRRRELETVAAHYGNLLAEIQKHNVKLPPAAVAAASVATESRRSGDAAGAAVAADACFDSIMVG